MADFQLTQRVGEVLDWAVDWRPFLAGASMISGTAAVSGSVGGLTLTDIENDGNKTGFTLEGATAGAVYEVTVIGIPSSNTSLKPDQVIEVYISP